MVQILKIVMFLLLVDSGKLLHLIWTYIRSQWKWNDGRDL